MFTVEQETRMRMERIESRVVRIETRLIALMEALGVGKKGESLRQPDTDRMTVRGEME